MAKLIKIKEHFDLCDTWRLSNLDAKEFTFRQKHASSFIQRRLDHFFISNSLQDVVSFRLHCSCFILFPSVHSSLFMFHHISLSPHFIEHFIYHSPSRLCLPYLVVFMFYDHSTSFSVSLFSQSRLRKLTTYECL